MGAWTAARLLISSVFKDLRRVLCLCRVAGAVNIGFAAFFNFGGPMKTFFLLITFYLSNNTPLHVERQATFLEGARPVRTMEECLSVAADQEARFKMAFAKSNGLLKKKVKIKCREGK